MNFQNAQIPLRAAIALADDGPDVDEVAAMSQFVAGSVETLERAFAGAGKPKQKSGAPGPRDFRSVFGAFVRSEADAAVSRVQVDDPATREAVRCEAAAKAMLSAAEVPGADRLAAAVSVKTAKERARLMSCMREAVELDRGVSAWSGKRLPAAELERRRRDLDPLHVYAANKLIDDPEGCAASVAVRGWMSDPAADVLKKARPRSGSDMER